MNVIQMNARSSAVDVAIELAEARHRLGWAGLRAELWPDTTAAEHAADIATFLAEILARRAQVAFIALDQGTAIGFAEASLRHDYVNGCKTSPVVFLEGIYVRGSHRRTGIGKRLLSTIEDWGRGQGCTEMASDADLANIQSHDFHAGIGFSETQRVIFFRKLL
jgi:aminoglycoside 6'-N-acetyltransferase I